MDDSDTVQARLDNLRNRMAAACARAGRSSDGVRLLAISKTFGPAAVQAAADCGLREFGESKVQEARQKIPLCPGQLSWHLVGHLQSNKVKEAVRLFETIQAVDSLKLLQAIESACETMGRRMTVLLEVNVSGEGSKFGLAPEAVPGLLAEANGLKRVEIAGLMTLPPLTPEPEGARPHFRKLRELRDEWRQASGYALDTLSMGMSRDFEIAIEEGATCIRVGTALFGGRA